MQSSRTRAVKFNLMNKQKKTHRATETFTKKKINKYLQKSPTQGHCYEKFSRINFRTKCKFSLMKKLIEYKEGIFSSFFISNLGAVHL